MLLNELYKLGKQVKIPFGMTTTRAIKFLITLSEDGQLRNIENCTAVDCLLSSVTRGTNIEANFLYDSFDYVAGIDFDGKNKKLDEKHGKFLDKLKDAYKVTQNKSLGIVIDFYENGGRSKIIDFLSEYPLSDSKGFVGFRIETQGKYIRLHDEQELIEYYSSKFESNQNNFTKGQCSITGKNDQPLISTTHRKIKGFPKPARPEGSALYCNNFASVTDIGKNQLLSSNISVEADKYIVAGFEYLLSNKEHNLEIPNSGVKFVYWIDLDLEEQFDFSKLLMDDAISIKEIDDFLKSFTSNTNLIGKIQDSKCHLIEIDCKTSRPHLRYQELDTSKLLSNLNFWYSNIKNADRYPSIKKINKVLVYNKKTYNFDLVKMAFFGEETSKALISRINQICFSNRGPFESNKRKFLSNDLISIINFILERNNMNNPNNNTNNNAHIIGQMLALTDKLQKSVLGETNSIFSSDNYNSNNIPLLFEKMDKKIRIYLSILKQDKPGLGYYFENQYNEMVSNLNPDSLPSKFTPIESLWKSKGFSDFKTTKINKNEKEL